MLKSGMLVHANLFFTTSDHFAVTANFLNKEFRKHSYIYNKKDVGGIVPRVYSYRTNLSVITVTLT